MDYRVHIKQFDGPLDLLLHLVEKAEIDIRDIFVSEITNEFLEYMKQLDELDLDSASEFLTVAATLVYAKSRSLFPPEPKDDENDEEDPAEQLIRRLREYKLFKEASGNMRSLAKSASQMRTKQPEEFPLPPKEIILRDTTVDRLFEAMLAALSRVKDTERAPAVHAVRKDAFTIRSCTKKVRGALVKRGGKITFTELIEGAERMEMIVIFMSLLEMISAGEISVYQKKYLGEIVIKAETLAGDDRERSYMDEQE